MIKSIKFCNFASNPYDGTKIDNEMDNWIESRLDDFLNKKGRNYLNMNIFNEIFERLEDPDFKRKNPVFYSQEIQRLREMKSAFEAAIEEGRKEERKRMRKEGRKERSIEIAIESLKLGMDPEFISKITNLPKDVVESFKEE